MRILLLLFVYTLICVHLSVQVQSAPALSNSNQRNRFNTQKLRNQIKLMQVTDTQISTNEQTSTVDTSTDTSGSKNPINNETSSIVDYNELAALITKYGIGYFIPSRSINATQDYILPQNIIDYHSFIDVLPIINNATNLPFNDEQLLTYAHMRPFPYRPDLGEYRLEGPFITPIEITKLNYTNRDFIRWDSYEPTLGFVPSFTTPPISLVSSSTSSASKLSDLYLSNFEYELRTTFYNLGYIWFRSFQLSDVDLLNDVLIKQNNFQAADVMMNVSFTINQAYNIYRAQILQNNLGNNIDFDSQTIDWLSLPTVPQVIDWFEKYLDAVFVTQSYENQTITRSPAGGPFPSTFSSYGHFRVATGYNSTYSQYDMVFWAPGFGVLMTHYIHLVSTPMVRKIRRSVLASLSALYSAIELFENLGVTEYASTAQWMFRIAGLCTLTNGILLTEKILKQRNEWRTTDEIIQIDRLYGGWVTDDMLQYVTMLVDRFVARTKRCGINEFLSTYYGVTMDLLSVSLLHAPSQYIYDQLTYLWQMHWFDIIANYLPGAGSMSGASGRSYDLMSGAHSITDRYDIRQYMLYAYKPYCDTNPTEILCTLNSPYANRPNGDAAYSFNRMAWSMWHMDRIGYVPLQLLFDINIDAQYRIVEQRFNDNIGQERFNYITPYYSVSHAGDNIDATAASIFHAIRLVGQPNRNKPTPIIMNEQSYSLNYIRTLLDFNDDPLSVGGVWDPIALNQQIAARYLTTQYQSYQLITSLIGGQQWMSEIQKRQGHNSNILIPLAADAIYANDVLLPVTVGTYYTIPPNTLITVRHGNASVVIRLLLAEHDSSIPDATTIGPYTGDIERVITGSNLQPYTIMWRVDASAVNAGSGRLVVHHKDTNNVPLPPYHISWFIGAGITRNTNEMQLFQRVIREATVTQTLVENNWERARSGKITLEVGDPFPSPVSECYWYTSVQLPQGITLSVNRTDVFQNWNFDPAFRNSLHQPPFYYKQWSRLVNQQPILQFNAGAEPFRVTKQSITDYYSPHTAARWRYTAYGTCSGACGTQTRTAGCIRILDGAILSDQECLSQGLTPITSRACNTDLCGASWQYGTWSICSASCGGGTQTRTTSCVATSANIQVDISACIALPMEPSQRTCNTDPCITYSWQYSTWGQCSASCGGGTSIRTAICVGSNGIAVDNSFCNTIPILTSQSCNTDPCAIIRSYSWNYGVWLPCSAGCEGTQTRPVTCIDDTGTVVADAFCTSPKDATQQACNSDPCSSFTRVYTAWSSCSTNCGGGIQTRSPTDTCLDANNIPVHSSRCTINLATQQVCNTNPCITSTAAWVYGSWSSCSATCGTGTSTRTATCTLTYSNGTVSQAADPSVCTTTTTTAAITSIPCNTTPCNTYRWFTGQWGVCSRECSTGVQTRNLYCVDQNGVIVPFTSCDSTSMPLSSQPCNTDPCSSTSPSTQIGNIAWRALAWSACSVECGGGTQTRVVRCYSFQDSSMRPDAACVNAGIKPITQAPCNTQPC